MNKNYNQTEKSSKLNKRSEEFSMQQETVFLNTVGKKVKSK